MKAHYILIAALCGLAGCREDNGAADAANRREMPPLKVSVMNMEQRTVELKSSWFGHLRGVEQADIRPQVSGTLIRQVYWDGSICNKGELLFEIDPATYQAAVDREAANLATARAVKLQAEASLNRVQKDLDRYDKLIRTGAISVKNLTDAQQNLKEMQAALEQAEAAVREELELLQHELVDEQELEKVKNKFESTQIFGNINYLNVATNLAWFELLGRAEDMEKEVERYRSVTAEQLRTVAQSAFRKENGVVLYYKSK